MHGDQPAANPIPTMKERKRELLCGRKCKRLSIASSGMRKIPVMCKPKMIITMPPIRAVSLLYGAKAEPTTLDDNPISMKMRVKPAMKAHACKKIRALISPDFAVLRSSRLVPVRNEKYEGTSGKTHGEAKERRPAKKAATALSSEGIWSVRLRMEGAFAPVII